MPSYKNIVCLPFFKFCLLIDLGVDLCAFVSSRCRGLRDDSVAQLDIFMASCPPLLIGARSGWFFVRSSSISIWDESEVATSGLLDRRQARDMRTRWTNGNSRLDYSSAVTSLLQVTSLIYVNTLLILRSPSPMTDLTFWQPMTEQPLMNRTIRTSYTDGLRLV